MHMRFTGSRAPLCGLLAIGLVACGKSDSSGPGSGGTPGMGGANGAPTVAGIQMRLGTPPPPPSAGNRLLAFSGGGAVRPGLESLEYFILSVQVCEDMDATGSGFSNTQGCLELYSGDHGALAYELDGDWTPLANAARALDTGFVDLLNPSSRQALTGTTELRTEHVRSYHYGIITWSLPIKVKATVALGDGTFLYTHDGETTFETIGADNFRAYFTAPATPLNVGPAEKAIVILGNGGNWFKFQNPLTISQADIDERRQWVLDLVFNPEGIVKGFSGQASSNGNLRERSAAGVTPRTITVPMLDLAPIPHRQSEQVVRESYLAHMRVGSHAFDTRLELYSVDGDPNGTVYGVDAKTLVTPSSTQIPPELSKISYVVPQADGSLSFQSFNQSSIITGFRRVAEELGTTTASVVCATHSNRAGAAGGAAIVLDSCPAPSIEVTFTLLSRSLLDGEVPSIVGPADAGNDAAVSSDAGSDAAAPSDAGGDAAAPSDAGSDAAVVDAAP
jgi:hypothetical protein